MAYNHEEQEQLDVVKAWWKTWGNLVTWALVAVLAAYSAWMGWNNWQKHQADQAALLFDELQKAVAAKDNGKVQRAATDMQEKFTRTAYAQMGGLAAAKAAYDTNDVKQAKERLQWVASHAVTDEYKAIASLRLAGLLLDEKAYDEALKILAGKFPAALQALVADRKGDVLAAQNKVAEARVAYQQALDQSDQKSQLRQLIQLKLDALGGSIRQPA